MAEYSGFKGRQIWKDHFIIQITGDYRADKFFASVILYLVFAYLFYNQIQVMLKYGYGFPLIVLIGFFLFQGILAIIFSAPVCVYERGIEMLRIESGFFWSLTEGLLLLKNQGQTIFIEWEKIASTDINTMGKNSRCLVITTTDNKKYISRIDNPNEFKRAVEAIDPEMQKGAKTFDSKEDKWKKF